MPNVCVQVLWPGTGILHQGRLHDEGDWAHQVKAKMTKNLTVLYYFYSVP